MKIIFVRHGKDDEKYRGGWSNLDLVPVVKEEKLREMNNGVLVGMLNEEALIKYPGLFFSSLEMDGQLQHTYFGCGQDGIRDRE